MSPPLTTVGYRDLFALPEFRAVWAAAALSGVGDQITRVGVATLVYTQTRSVAAAAGTYALTFFPALAGGLLLGRIADRYPRRSVMVATDTLRAGLVAAMALPGLPLPGLWMFLIVTVLVGPVFEAAAGALLPEIVPSGLYARAMAVQSMTHQAAQLVGFGLAGLVVVALGPSGALLADAATFLVSVMLLVVWVRRRPGPLPSPRS